jgi:hypothetical protein
MVHAPHLINFWLTLIHFQGRYRSLTCFRLIHDILGNNKARIFMFCMNVPYPKPKVWFVYGWTWPTFKVTIGLWPNFTLCFIAQVIMVLGSSNFARSFSNTRQSFSMGIIDLDLLSRSLTSFHIMLYSSSNNGARIFMFCMGVPYPKPKVWFVYGWPWPTFKVTIGHWPNFTLCFISQVIIVLGSSNFAWSFSNTRQRFSMVMIDLDLLSRSL